MRANTMNGVIEKLNPHKTLLQALNNVTTSPSTSEAERIELKEALIAALAKVESPWEAALRLVFTEPALLACLKICYDLRLFHKWVEELNGDPMTVEELSRVVEVDPILLARLLRHMSATHVIHQIRIGTFALTDFSRSLTTPAIGSMIPFSYQTTIPGYQNLPAYLQSTAYTNPADSTQTNWHHLRGISRFDELKQSPTDMSIFQAVMNARAASKLSWTDLFPVDLLLTSHNQDRKLLVDVGGGLGYDIERLRKQLAALNHPVPPKSFVLQDVQAAITSASDFDDTEKMEHDFFQPQPILGATAYYCHSVLHDWPDDRATEILRQLAGAAEQGYSRVLIHDMVVTDVPAVPQTTADMHMMMVLSARERTEAEWRDVVEKAGLEVVKVWTKPESLESVIEAIKR